MSTPSLHDSTLIRGLGPIAATAIVIGNVIGTGVFLKSRVMTCNVGTPGRVIAFARRRSHIRGTGGHLATRGW